MTEEISNPHAETMPRATPAARWVYGALVIGLAFLAGFSAATFLFANGGIGAGGEAPAGVAGGGDEPAPSSGGSEASVVEEGGGERLYTYGEVLDLLYQSVPLTEPTAPISLVSAHTTDEGNPALGAADAPVTIVEYSDFSCVYCRRFYNQTLPAILETYGDDVRFVYRHFPVLGQPSVLAAKASACAGAQGRFWEYHNYLFANPGAFHDLGFAAIAHRIALDLDAFQACQASDDVMPGIQVDFDAARELGATGTPSFTVNGEFVVGAQPFEVFQQMIDEKLAEATN